jgi:hypothetical protein
LIEGIPYFRTAPGDGIDGLLDVLSFDHRPSAVSARNSTDAISEKALFAGCSKTLRCKAPETLRRETYRAVRRNDEG